LTFCATIANSVWDPHAFNLFSGNDSDGDGAPNPCDTGGADNDQDADGWPNRLDNCAGAHNSEQPGNGGGTTPNTFQWDQDLAPETPSGDGGPNSDGMSPACDIPANGANLTPTAPNGQLPRHRHRQPRLHWPGRLRQRRRRRLQSSGAGRFELRGRSQNSDCDNDGVGDRLDCIAGANAPASGFAQSQRDLDANGFVDVIGDLATLAGAVGSQGATPTTMVSATPACPVVRGAWT
jgi:Thrombospondin type 3 repeat